MGVSSINESNMAVRSRPFFGHTERRADRLVKRCPHTQDATDLFEDFAILHGKSLIRQLLIE